MPQKNKTFFENFTRFYRDPAAFRSLVLSKMPKQAKNRALPQGRALSCAYYSVFVPETAESRFLSS
jgi:hypothetical protein